MVCCLVSFSFYSASPLFKPTPQSQGINPRRLAGRTLRRRVTNGAVMELLSPNYLNGGTLTTNRSSHFCIMSPAKHFRQNHSPHPNFLRLLCSCGEVKLMRNDVFFMRKNDFNLNIQQP